MQVGIDLGNKYGASISLLHVFPVATGYLAEENSALEYEEKLNNVKRNMEKITRELAEENKQSITNEVISGNVNEALLEFVEAHEFDLVIMGVNSNGSDNAPGSHTTRLIEKSSTPILVVPNNYQVHD